MKKIQAQKYNRHLAPLEENVLIGQRISMRRRLLNISCEKMGQILQISPQQYQKYEKGSSSISAVRLWTIARILNVELKFFYEDLENKNKLSSEIRQEPNFDPACSSEGIDLLINYFKIKNRQVAFFYSLIIDAFANDWGVKNERDGLLR